MKWILGTVLAISLLTTGCSNPKAPATPTPIEPTATDTFTGTLIVQGVLTHPFTVQQVGFVTVTITDMVPGAAVTLGVGAQSVSGCIVVQSVTAVAGTTPQLSGTAAAPGNFCISLADAGNLVEPVNYTVVVRHP